MTLTIPETGSFLRERDNFLIVSHRRPDGDTLGSAAALCLGLRKLGKSAWVLENPEITPRFQWLHSGLARDVLPENGTVVTVDVASPKMLPETAEGLKFDLRIDHHDAATDFTARSYVDSGSASCAEIIWEVLKEMDCPLDQRIAEALYVGASTDTGCFRFANTTAHTFLTAAACVQAGADTYRLNQALFETNSLGRLRIQGWIVDHMALYREGKLAVCAIPRSVEEQLGVTEDDMDNISNFPRTVDGVEMAATLRETAQGEVKLSVRAIPGRDATRVAVKFGGGGHKGAAGSTIAMPLEKATQAVRDAILEEA